MNERESKTSTYSRHVIVDGHVIIISIYFDRNLCVIVFQNVIPYNISEHNNCFER